MHEPVAEFYAWSQIVLCVVSALLMFSIYERGYLRVSLDGSRDMGRDRCFWYLAAGVGCWGLVGILVWRYPESLDPHTEIGCLRTMLSIVNTGLFLYAAAYLDHTWGVLRRLTRPSWATEILVLTVPAIAVTIVLWRTSPEPAAPETVIVARIPDVALSLLALGVLAAGLWRSFSQRRFHLMSAVSLVAIGLQVPTQLAELLQPLVALLGSYDSVFGSTRLLLLLTSKTILIVIFFALAFTWMHEMAFENARASSSAAPERDDAADGPAPSGPVVWLAGERKPGEKLRFFVWTRCELTRGTFLALLRIVEARIRAADDPDLSGALATDDSDSFHMTMKRLRTQTGSGVVHLVEQPGKKRRRLTVDDEHVFVRSRDLESDDEIARILRSLPRARFAEPDLAG
ncbi:MAG TPA: hypothetical protein VFB67_09815 [Candidatus Polarisedimenticolaceae bacterium]|nr:hypothetical protein [Candidatus Polarisedimenticolaceae bacterium]